MSLVELGCERLCEPTLAARMWGVKPRRVHPLGHLCGWIHGSQVYPDPSRSFPRRRGSYSRSPRRGAWPRGFRRRVFRNLPRCVPLRASACSYIWLCFLVAWDISFTARFHAILAPDTQKGNLCRGRRPRRLFGRLAEMPPRTAATTARTIAAADATKGFRLQNWCAEARAKAHPPTGHFQATLTRIGPWSLGFHWSLGLGHWSFLAPSIHPSLRFPNVCIAGPGVGAAQRMAFWMMRRTFLS